MNSAFHFGIPEVSIMRIPLRTLVKAGFPVFIPLIISARGVRHSESMNAAVALTLSE